MSIRYIILYKRVSLSFLVFRLYLESKMTNYANSGILVNMSTYFLHS